VRSLEPDHSAPQDSVVRDFCQRGDSLKEAYFKRDSQAREQSINTSSQTRVESREARSTARLTNETRRKGSSHLAALSSVNSRNRRVLANSVSSPRVLLFGRARARAAHYGFLTPNTGMRLSPPVMRHCAVDGILLTACQVTSVIHKLARDCRAPKKTRLARFRIATKNGRIARRIIIAARDDEL